MRALMSIISRILIVFGLFCMYGSFLASAQEESAEEEQYRADYERAQKIVAVSDTATRIEQLLEFLRQRPNSKMNDYVEGQYFLILDNLTKAGSKTELVTLSERYIKMRPRVGETYYFLGAGLKNAGEFEKAMDALAKCYVLKNRLSSKAKEFLDFIYKGRNKGSLKGLDAIIKKAKQDLNI